MSKFTVVSDRSNTGGGDSATRSANPSTEVLLKNGSVVAIVSKFNFFVYVLNLKN